MANFSMYFLFLKDLNGWNYLVLQAALLTYGPVFDRLVLGQSERSLLAKLAMLGVLLTLAVHPVAHYLIQPKIARYPDLFEVGCNAVSLGFFGCMLGYAWWLMYQEAFQPKLKTK